MTVTFRVDITPIGKARARVTKHGTYTPTATVSAENAVGMAYRAKSHHQWVAGVPLRLEVVAMFVRPKTVKRREYPTVKPDGSNILKLCEDALNGVAWHDDSQVVSSHILKKYGESAELIVLISDEL